jgi:hypothetical protein
MLNYAIPITQGNQMAQKITTSASTKVCRAKSVVCEQTRYAFNFAGRNTLVSLFAS